MSTPVGWSSLSPPKPQFNSDYFSVVSVLVGLTVTECVCPPDSKIKYSVFSVKLCSCIMLCVILLVSFMQS